MRRYTQHYTAALMFGVALAVGCPGLAWPWSWTREVVDTILVGPGVGQFSSLKIDSLDRPHISYYDIGNQNLNYAIKLSTGWSIATVDYVGNVGRWTSLALDRYRRPHISYYDASTPSIKYARKKLSGVTLVWATETVATGLPFGASWTSLAYHAGTPHISYHEGGAGLKYAHKTAAGWTIAFLDSTSTGPSTLAVDASGNLHLAYAASGVAGGGKLKYAKKVGGSWSFQTVATHDSPIDAVAMALDSQGRPHIAYYSWDIRTHIVYMYWDGFDWVANVAFIDQDPDLHGLTLALDSSDHVHLSYAGIPSNCKTTCLTYLRLSGGAWITETPDALAALLGVPHGQHPSLTIDASDKPRISYHVPGWALMYYKGD